jgi:hypothetical protein
MFLAIARYSGYAVSLMILFAWFYVYYKHSITNPILYWLPIADYAGILLAQYVDFDSLSLVNEVDNLESYRYEVKSV